MSGRRIATPNEKLQELIRLVRDVARNADEQIAKMRRLDYPLDELFLRLDDAVPGWFDRLASAGLLDENDCHRLLGLVRALSNLDFVTWSEDSLKIAPVWQEIRATARVLADDLDGHLPLALRAPNDEPNLFYE